ncbi:arylsulfatase [Fulvivirgaceae bacterium BMA10]|uniref:Arylsulfatase n=1 Tax=Splendidivirga corallicola TaxID=3051826 RepID=A0ABT8KUW8_9BACT|nr:arylsulfatase [Fulvivirgaceae bacterium BMA10]
MKQIVIRYWLFLSMVVLLMSCSRGTEKQPEVAVLPNIVYILADDMGYGDVSVLNPKSKIRTTNIDLLSETGIVFTDAHSTSAVCTPSRYSILTGRYPWRSDLPKGVLWTKDKALIRPERETVASMLQKQGYATGVIGKWHLGWNWGFRDDDPQEIDFSKEIKRSPNDAGFDYSYCLLASLDIPPYVYVENKKATAVPDSIVPGTSIDQYDFWRTGPLAPDLRFEDVLPNFTRRAVDFIKDQKDGKPFFLYFPLTAPHTPIVPSKEFQGKSGINPYLDFCLEVDWSVGEIIKVLKQNNMYNNTIIVFASDNGSSSRSANYPVLLSNGHNSSAGFRGAKGDIFEGGHRVPFIFSFPKLLKGKSTYEHPVSLVDFMATVADVTGFKLEENMAEDSFSFYPLVNNERDTIISRPVINASSDGSMALRESAWKLEMCAGSGGWLSHPTNREAEAIEGLPKYQLYNLDADPSERYNLMDENEKRVAGMISRFSKYVKNGRTTSGAPQKNDTEVPESQEWIIER